MAKVKSPKQNYKVIIGILIIAMVSISLFISSCGNDSISSHDEATFGNTEVFISEMQNNGFYVQEGQIKMIDILKLCSEGYLTYCFGNNAGFPYLAFLMPPAPRQNPAEGQDPPINYDPSDPNNYPANLDSIPPGITFKLRPDEAVVFIGKTPPKARYFSYRSYIGFRENIPGKDYSNVYTDGNDVIGHYHRIFASLGDPLNHLTMKTMNTPNGTDGDAFNSDTVLIISPNRETNSQVRQALIQAGFSGSIINDDTIPNDLVNLGLEKGKDTFTILVRASLWEDQQTGQAFMDNPGTQSRVFRVTPKDPLTPAPYDIPTLKVRGNGVSEYALVPNAESDLERIRQGIINRYGGADYNYTELETTIWIPEGYVGISQDMDVLAEDRDTSYLRSDYFQLKSDDDFVVVYGVNHEETKKAIYCNFSFYGVELVNGVAGTNSSVFYDSAKEYFPSGYGNSRYYYAYKLARQAQAGENCVIVEKSTGNPNGKAFGVDNNKDAFIAYRAYIETETKIGPAPFELIYDKAILFTKKQAE